MLTRVLYFAVSVCPRWTSVPQLGHIYCYEANKVIQSESETNCNNNIDSSLVSVDTAEKIQLFKENLPIDNTTK